MPLPVPTIPSLPSTCRSPLDKRVGIVLFYKDKTAFITGATVKFKHTLSTGSFYAATDGVLYSLCLPTGLAVSAFAQKAGIDFGAGVGVEARVGSATLSDRGFSNYMFPPFVANTPFPCPVVTPQIAASNFSSPAATPNVTVLPISGTIPNIGNFSVTEGEYEIRLDEILITNGSIPSDGKINTNLPAIKDIPSLVGKTSTTLKVIIKWYHCTFTASKTVTLPKPPPIEIPCFGELGINLTNVYDILSTSPTLPSSINVPVFITGATGDIKSTKINIFVGDINVGSVYAGQTIDLIRVLTGRVPDITISNKITLVSESPECIKEKTFDIPPLIPTGVGVLPPSPPTCSDTTTTVDSVNHDKVLPSTPSTPFFISINKIKLECPSNPVLTKKMKNEVGTVTLGSLSAQFPIPSIGQSDGEVYEDLSKLIDMSQIIGGTPVITPPPITIPSPILPTKPKGDFGANIPAAISYLSTYHPGKWLSVEPTTFGGGKYVKVTRANNSYTYARTYEELDGAMSY